MSLPAIEVSGLSKRYVIEHESRHDNLRDTLHHTARKLWRRFRWGTGFEREEFWALRDVSFSVQPGEVVGIIGRNGAGKSTLLKILSRITEPTAGQIKIRGRVASLLEVGTGFHPELTGRENIFLNGAILGMHRAEIRKKFDEIVAFAEVDRFLDTPVKRYSSGMYVRLAFAVAAHLEPEILIVDEVLAVGDSQFQKKCLGKMQDVSRNQGRAVLVVSHNLSLVRQLSTTGILLQNGRVVTTGPIADVCATYGANLAPNDPAWKRTGAATGPCWFDSVLLTGEWTPDRTAFALHAPITLSLRITAARDLAVFQVAVRVCADDGSPVFTTTNADHSRQTGRLSAGQHEFSVILPPLLAPGRYRLVLALCDPKREIYDLLDNGPSFTIDSATSLGLDMADGRLGVIELSLPWTHTSR